MYKKYLTVAALSAITINAQQQQPDVQVYNGTILQLLNDSTISPATKFSEFLYNSSDYQSIIDILNDTNHNLTFFLPSDQVYYEATGETPPSSSDALPTSTVANDASTTSSVSSSTQDIGGLLSSLMGAFSSQQATATQAQPTGQQAVARALETATSLSSMELSQKNEWFNPLVNYKVKQLQSTDNEASGWEAVTTDATYADQFSYLDIIYYHLVNGSVELNSENSTLVLDSLLTNQSVVKSGSSAPLLVQLNSTELQSDSSSQNSTDGDSTTFGNWTVGTGLEEGAQINQTFQTTNGIVYVINQVLIPPTNTSDTLEALDDTAYFTLLLSQSNVSLDAQSNFTVFVPDNKAIQGISLAQLNNETLNNFVQAHIVPGIYYTTNVTSSAEITSVGGTNITLNESNNNVTVDNFNITKPNVLMNNGVLHLIDGVLNYTVVQSGNDSTGDGGSGSPSSTTTADSSSSTGTDVPSSTGTDQPFATTSGGQTATGDAFPGPSSSANSAATKLNYTPFSSVFFYLILSFLF